VRDDQARLALRPVVQAEHRLHHPGEFGRNVHVADPPAVGRLAHPVHPEWNRERLAGLRHRRGERDRAGGEVDPAHGASVLRRELQDARGVGRIGTRAGLVHRPAQDHVHVDRRIRPGIRQETRARNRLAPASRNRPTKLGFDGHDYLP
jgi:hypothetical protein